MLLFIIITQIMLQYDQKEIMINKTDVTAKNPLNWKPYSAGNSLLQAYRE